MSVCKSKGAGADGIFGGGFLELSSFYDLPLECPNFIFKESAFEFVGSEPIYLRIPILT